MAGPNQWATIPDSNPPNSFDVPMNKLFTADTRPRFSSGVSNCTNVCRTTTLMLSTKPQMKSITNETQNHFETPKPIVANPKAATAHSSERPAFCSGGRCASTNAQSNDPNGKAAWSTPSPSGPTRSTSLA